MTKKRKSKRMTLKTKYMIEKKVRAHKKKVKRLKKKKPELFKAKKDPGVPKSLPFYKEVIEEAQREKELAKEHALEAVKVRQSLLEKKEQFERLTEMAESAKRRAEDYEKRMGERREASGGKFTDQSAKKYYREFKKVVEASDVVLEVLDARDPMGSRAPKMEEMIVSKGKKLVLVLNKCDLVPRNNVEGWLQYLRQEYPTVLFKAVTQKQTKQLGQNKSYSTSNFLNASYDEITSSKAIGTEILMQLLKNYCRNKDIKLAITVGVVGIPNVGKSSIINSMKRSKTCGVGGTPGVTRTLQDVRLDSKINILDCPGIVLPGGNASDAMSALKNAVKIEQLKDPMEAVRAIYDKGNKEQLRKLYWTGKTNSFEEFLSKLAKRIGRLTKGGVANRDMAARKILQDWSSGVIKYYTEPPKVVQNKVEASLKSTLSQEFSLDSLYASDSEQSYLSKLGKGFRFDTLHMETLGPITEMKGMNEAETEEEEQMEQQNEMEEEGGEDEEDMEEMETEDKTEESEENEQNDILPKNLCIGVEEEAEETPAEEKKPRWENPVEPFDPDTMSLKQYSKKMKKKLRKETNRNERRADDLTDMMEQFTGISEEKNDSYDFSEFF